MIFFYPVAVKREKMEIIWQVVEVGSSASDG